MPDIKFVLGEPLLQEEIAHLVRRDRECLIFRSVLVSLALVSSLRSMLSTLAGSERLAVQEPGIDMVQIGEVEPETNDTDSALIEEEQMMENLMLENLLPTAGNGYDHGTHCFTQTPTELTVTVPVPAGTKGRMLDVRISRNKVSVGFRGKDPIIAGELIKDIRVDDSTWEIMDGKLVEVYLMKMKKLDWWDRVFQSDRPIDTKKMRRQEVTNMNELDVETRETAQRMMYDQHQKARGAPTIDQQIQMASMRNFAAASDKDSKFRDSNEDIVEMDEKLKQLRARQQEGGEKPHLE
eukprot:gnl/TRDRNA2_/TRDRNA2_74314_c0_seq1.p1 gnl/TRDRNA2_/TRDRNA2_74314_c0~~gnl/TRDRNA2_/TRDRNA2_74314_c0_seq1.p1  ORF type:complete len:295 (-),score=50.33 gnl/TRDRNA2_/TRDRNA2_74314_c0_seq1:385-1269(-)